MHLRHLPVANEAEAALPDLLNGREGNAGVPKSEQPCGNSELGADVPSKNGLRVNAEFLGEVERALQASELRYVTKHLGLVHVDRAVPSFDEANDVLVEQALLVFVGDLADAGFPSHQFLESVFRKHPVHAGQTERNTGHDVRVHVPL